MELKEPYTIAYETVSRTTNIFFRIETSSGLNGLGCAAPDRVVTGETPESALAALRNVVGPLIRGCDPLRRMSLIERMRRHLPDAPSARAAADIALHDLLGKAAGLPLWRLLGGYRRSITGRITCASTSVLISRRSSVFSTDMPHGARRPGVIAVQSAWKRTASETSVDT